MLVFKYGDSSIRTVEMSHKYRTDGLECTGTRIGIAFYKRGIRLAKKGNKYDEINEAYRLKNNEFCKRYSKKGLKFFKIAAGCFKIAALFGNDLAMMNYAMYLYCYKSKEKRALKLFKKASNIGLAIADFQLFAFYHDGCCGLKKNIQKARHYFDRYLEKIYKDERQHILCMGIDYETGVMNAHYMFSNFCGSPFYDICIRPYITVKDDSKFSLCNLEKDFFENVKKVNDTYYL